LANACAAKLGAFGAGKRCNCGWDAAVQTLLRCTSKVGQKRLTVDRI